MIVVTALGLTSKARLSSQTSPLTGLITMSVITSTISSHFVSLATNVKVAGKVIL
jgi:hypothetical protein